VGKKKKEHLLLDFEHQHSSFNTCIISYNTTYSSDFFQKKLLIFLKKVVTQQVCHSEISPYIALNIALGVIFQYSSS